MDISHKAKLHAVLKKWLQTNWEDVCGNNGIWYDNEKDCDTHADMLTNACEVVIESMVLQAELEQRYT